MDGIPATTAAEAHSSGQPADDCHQFSPLNNEVAAMARSFGVGKSVRDVTPCRIAPAAEFRVKTIGGSSDSIARNPRFSNHPDHPPLWRD